MSFLSQGTSKQGVNQEKEAEKRRDVALTLRKGKKAEILKEKRRKETSSTSNQLAEQFGDGLDDRRTPEQMLEELPQCRQHLENGTYDQMLAAAMTIRKLLSVAEQPPIGQVIALGCVPYLVHLLRADQHTNLQFEAAWAITNVASGTQQDTNEVIEHNAIPEFVRLLGSPDPAVRDQVIWALGNIAGDCYMSRDVVLDAGALPPVLKIVESCLQGNQKLDMLRNATWCLSNFMRSKPVPSLEKVHSALPYLAVLLNNDDTDVVSDACWAMSYASDGPDDRIDSVLQSGQPAKVNVAARLAELLNNPEHALHSPALRTVGNIVSGSSDSTQMMIEAGVLPLLMNLLSSTRKVVKKECCWALSNIAAGTTPQVTALVASGVLSKLSDLMRQDVMEVRKEACFTVANVLSAKIPEQVVEVVNANCIEALVDVLRVAPNTKNSSIQDKALEAIDVILMIGAQFQEKVPEQFQDQWRERLIACGGLELIEALQSSMNSAIYIQAGKILGTYFGDMADDIDETGGINDEALLKDSNFQF